MKTLKQYIDAFNMSAFDITRENMPQLKDVELFKQFLKSKNVEYDIIKSSVKNLTPTQKDFIVDKVNAIADNNLFDKPIVISNDGYVIDGHHRFIAAHYKDVELTQIIVDRDVTDSLALAYEYQDYIQQFDNETE